MTKPTKPQLAVLRKMRDGWELNETFWRSLCAMESSGQECTGIHFLVSSARSV